MPDNVTAPVDWTRFQALAGGEEAARDLVGFYIPFVVERLDALRSAVRAAEADQIAAIAHQLGGSVAAAGVTGMIRPLVALEQMAFDGRLTMAEAALADAETGFVTVREFLLQYVEAVQPDARRPEYGLTAIAQPQPIAVGVLDVRSVRDFEIEATLSPARSTDEVRPFAAATLTRSTLNALVHACRQLRARLRIRRAARA